MDLNNPPSIPRAEYAERRDRARQTARDAGLDGLLVWSMGGSTLDSYGDVFYLTNHFSVEPKAPNVRPYWTGFGHACVIVPVEGEAALLVGPPNWRRDLVAIDEVRDNRDLYAETLQCLQDKGLANGRIGISRETLLPLPLYHELRQALPGAELVAADDVLEQLRIRKSAAEVAMMRHASAVSVEMMNALLGEAAEGRTDGDLVAKSFAVGTRYNADPYEFAFSSGPTSEHWYWPRLPGYDTKRPYEQGDLLHPDIFGCVDGYFYDFQRSTIVGRRPSDGQREALEAVVEFIHYICDKLRPGARACDAHRAGIDWLAESGWGAIMSSGETDASSFPAFGHGIGVGWEGPWITATDETVLEPGMTIAIEGAIQRPGVATAILEETVLVTDGEPEIMTSGCPTHWWD
jgi:Xaa-Pro aminopeptidase